MTKIEWCDETWNPVWGCLRECPYCYARGIARRFGKTADERAYLPTLREDNLEPKFAKSTKRVFVGSMSDCEYWKEEWWDIVIEAVQKYPEIDFIFLTKGGRNVYRRFLEKMRGYPRLEPIATNIILGFTRCTNADLRLKDVPIITDHIYRWLINIEPIMEPIKGMESVARALTHFDWLILGAETGRRPHKPVPTWFWFNQFLRICWPFDGPSVFIKPSLQSVTPPDYYRQDYCHDSIMQSLKVTRDD